MLGRLRLARLQGGQANATGRRPPAWGAQLVHDVQPGERIFAVVEWPLVKLSQIDFDIPPGQGRPTKDDRHRHVTIVEGQQVFLHHHG